MANVLIVYGTTEGQTEKISKAIAQTLIKKGHNAKPFSSESAPSGEALLEYDGIIVGSSVHIGKFHKKIQPWVKQNLLQLQYKPTAFFSVCLGILENNPQTQLREHKIVEDFFRETGWTPPTTTIFAGALMYSKYGWFKKQMLKIIAKKADGDTDVSRDYEYTNWDDVREFTQRFEALLRQPGTVRALYR